MTEQEANSKLALTKENSGNTDMCPYPGQRTGLPFHGPLARCSGKAACSRSHTSSRD